MATCGSTSGCAWLPDAVDANATSPSARLACRCAVIFVQATPPAPAAPAPPVYPDDPVATIAIGVACIVLVIVIAIVMVFVPTREFQDQSSVGA